MACTITADTEVLEAVPVLPTTKQYQTHRDAFVLLQGILEELDWIIAHYEGGEDEGYATLWVFNPETRGNLRDITNDVSVVLGRKPGPFKCDAWTRHIIGTWLARELFASNHKLNVRWI